MRRTCACGPHTGIPQTGQPAANINQSIGKSVHPSGMDKRSGSWDFVTTLDNMLCAPDCRFAGNVTQHCSEDHVAGKVAASLHPGGSDEASDNVEGDAYFPAVVVTGHSSESEDVGRMRGGK